MQKCLPFQVVIIIVVALYHLTELKLFVFFSSLFLQKVNTVGMIYNWSAVPSPHWSESNGANLSSLAGRSMLSNQWHLTKCSQQVVGTSLRNCSRLKQTYFNTAQQSKLLIKPRGSLFTHNSISKWKWTEKNKIVLLNKTTNVFTITSCDCWSTVQVCIEHCLLTSHNFS